MEILKNLGPLINYCLNPFTEESVNSRTKFHSLHLGEKVSVVFLTALAALMTAGIGGIPAFCYLVHRFEVLNSNELGHPSSASRVNGVAI